MMPFLLVSSVISCSSASACEPYCSESRLSHFRFRTSSQIRPTTTQRLHHVTILMPRAHQRVELEGSIFSRVVEQGWVAFLILGALMVALRLYNVKQRRDQRKLLREGLMAEMRYCSKANRKRE
ncbi:hypothetical protein LSCM4_04081 [Leishmania orientalis]|uniref:Uncharacterized protein n=1 Tax=Leishmania orientalis TaxID=2249476 RepID=A0A836GKL9_9TRYP|nr:hypothetical protein LSCM4_04081 [Leishmania orientalis]